MRKTIGIGCVILLLYGLCCSCTYEKDIWIEEEKPCAVLNAIVRQDSVIRVHLSRTLNGALVNPEDQSSLHRLCIDDAQIELWVNSICRGKLQKTEGKAGEYNHSYRPAAGDRIRLKALTAEYDPVEAETAIPFPPEAVVIDTLGIERWDEYGDLQKDLRFHITIQDRPEEENFYLLSFEPMIHYQSSLVDTVFLNRSFWDRIEMPQDPRVESGNMRYGKEFFQYGYLGGYGSWHIGFKEKTAFLLKDEGSDGEELTFDFTASSLREPHQMDTVSCTYGIRIQLASISRSYYLYRRSKALQMDQEDILGDLDLREPQPAYSNVTAGWGLLASYHPIWIFFEWKSGAIRY